jgi:hypothetical protein
MAALDSFFFSHYGSTILIESEITPIYIRLCSPPVVAGALFHWPAWNKYIRNDTIHKLKGMHHDFRALDRKKHDAGDLELDPMDPAMSGKLNLSLSESESATTPKSDYQSVR